MIGHLEGMRSRPSIPQRLHRDGELTALLAPRCLGTATSGFSLSPDVPEAEAWRSRMHRKPARARGALSDRDRERGAGRREDSSGFRSASEGRVAHSLMSPHGAQHLGGRVIREMQLSLPLPLEGCCHGRKCHRFALLTLVAHPLPCGRPWPRMTSRSKCESQLSTTKCFAFHWLRSLSSLIRLTAPTPGSAPRIVPLQWIG